MVGVEIIKDRSEVKSNRGYLDVLHRLASPDRDRVTPCGDLPNLRLQGLPLGRHLARLPRALHRSR